MVYELTDNYLPDFFPHREKEISKIDKTFKIYNERKGPLNLVIFGTSGSGKTSIINRTIKRYDNFIYISCAKNNSTNKLLRKLTGLTFRSTSELQDKFIDSMKANPKILILDEVNRINSITELGDFLNTVYREAYIPIVLITNRWNLIEEMPEDARLTLLLDRVDFSSYNAIQMQDILKYRLGLLKERVDIDEGILSYICGATLRNHFGSIRVALDVLRKCIIEDNFSFEYIQQQFENIQKQDWASFSHKLNDTEREFFSTILDLLEDRSEISLQEVNNKMSTVTLRRVSQIADDFVDYGLLAIRRSNSGRAGGPSKMLSFSAQGKKDKQELLDQFHPWVNDTSESTRESL